MKILGLTGSIGMGKSTASAMLRRLGIPVHDADAVVHRLLGKGGAAVLAIASIFPDAFKCGTINRAILAEHVFKDKNALYLLESILHPLVRQAELRFLRKASAERRPLVVLDIPLLFETGAQLRCNAVAVLVAPSFVQSSRVMRRQGMTHDKWNSIRMRQTSEPEKRRRANVIVPSGLGLRPTLRVLRTVVAAMSTSPPSCRQILKKGGAAPCPKRMWEVANPKREWATTH